MRLFLILAAAASLTAQTGENVLLVVNGKDASSREIAEYYRPRRSVPVKNVCTLSTTSDEVVGAALARPDRPNLDRGSHREGHLDDIEKALAGFVERPGS